MIRILIADDHTIFRSGLKLLLAGGSDFEVVGEADSGSLAVQMAGELQPDIVLIDIAMPELNGIEATRQIKTRYPDINVLVLTMHRSDEYFFKALDAGASGYVLKGAETSELINALRAVGRDEVFLYPSVARRLVEKYFEMTPGDRTGISKLTPREQEILQLLAEGYSNQEIAERLVISPSTVHTHRTNLMEKLNLSKRFELVRYARQHGFIHET
ncbi:MAG: response regulator transcription factor [Anaerolineales bacterium]|jgi:two-component system response regulator NreC